MRARTRHRINSINSFIPLFHNLVTELKIGVIIK